MDRNLFHISYEGGILEDPWLEPDESMFILTRDPGKAPDKPRYHHSVSGRRSGFYRRRGVDPGSDNRTFE